VIGSRRWRQAITRLSLLIVMITGLVGPSAGFGQPLPNNTVSVDPAVIGRQIRAAISLGEQARARLSSPGTDDNAATHQLLDTMYRQVRRALGNLNDRKAVGKLPDPILDMEITKVTFAWNTIRRPVDGYFNSPAKDEWKAGAAQDLQVTMATLRQVEAMLP
jgi:hypothetical protein